MTVIWSLYVLWVFWQIKISKEIIDNYQKHIIFFNIPKNKTINEILNDAIWLKIIITTWNKITINPKEVTWREILFLTIKNNKLKVLNKEDFDYLYNDIQICEKFVNKNINDNNEKINEFKKCIVYTTLKKNDRLIQVIFWITLFFSWFFLLKTIKRNKD